MDLKDKIRSIEDYPQKGVIFRDITIHPFSTVRKAGKSFCLSDC